MAQCEQCGKEFDTEQGLNVHIGLEHKGTPKSEQMSEINPMDFEDLRNKVSEKNKGVERPWATDNLPQTRHSEKLGHKVDSGWEEQVFVMLAEAGIDYEHHVPFDIEIQTYYADAVVNDVVIEVKGPQLRNAVEKAEQFMSVYDSKTYIVVGEKIPCDKHYTWEQRQKLIKQLTE